MPDYAADPDIKKALDAGYSLDQISDPETQGMLGEAVTAAADQFGPGSPEEQAAIDAANESAVMLTSARAAYNRIKAAG